MHTFYYADHTRHNPARLHRPNTPQKNSEYSEVAQRGKRIHQALKRANFGPIVPPADFGIAPITDVHDQAMVTLLQTISSTLDQDIIVPDTFAVRTATPHRPRHQKGLLGYYSFDVYAPIFRRTWEVVYWAAQTAVSAAMHVLDFQHQTAYALTRPPGHHAATDLIGGYCYLNNAAIAANWLTEQGQRVALVDIDYHHGNGTQEIFYNRSDVLFCSIHADPYEQYPFYWGFADEYGIGPGEHYNFNFPLPVGTEDLDYIATFTKLLEQVRRFVPDVLLVSLGVDTFAEDPQGSFLLQTATFTRLGEHFATLNLPTVVIQEGGYHLDSLGDNVVAFFRGLLGV